MSRKNIVTVHGFRVQRFKGWSHMIYPINSKTSSRPTVPQAPVIRMRLFVKNDLVSVNIFVKSGE